VKLPDLRRPSLALRLVLLAGIWSVVILAVTGVFLTALFHEESVSRFDDSLLDVANGLYAGSNVDPNGEVDAPPLTDSRAMRAYSGKYWQIAEPAAGRVHALARSRSLWDSELKPPDGGVAALQAVAGKPVYYDTTGPVGEPLRAVAMLTHLSGRSQPVIFMAAEDRTPLDSDARRFDVETAGGLLILGVGLVLVVFVQVRVGLQPLFMLQGEVAAVRTGQAERLVQEYPSELESLALELNALVAHDQEVVERQRTHVGNLAHALKTPLSVMLAEADRHSGPLAEVVERQAEAMRTQVDHHLRRARAAARSQGARERTVVAPVLEELAHALERIFRDRNVEIDWRAPDDLCFQGERQDLMEMVGNILENACKYGGGRIRAIAAPLDGRRLRLVVEDNGPGLPEGRHAEVLRRGARLDESAPGSGLGLAIVDELARAYGGTVALANAASGGLQVVLELPRVEG
jgi:signal transduction histidine kinase